MIGLPSEERFGNVEVSKGEPPKHTSDGHEKCTYYLVDLAPEPGDGVAILGMICPHGVAANGGFISEDLNNEQRRVAQQFLGEVQGLIRNHPSPGMLMPSLEEFKKVFE